MSQHTVTITDDEDREIEVTANYSPPYIGRREYGAPIEPDELAEFEICGATMDGEEIELTEKQENDALEACWNIEE